ncbi:MAG: DJ-1/PfpI family protein [Bacteroidota bacterium]
MITTINILLFDDIELLDFAGPLEVFTVLDYLRPDLGLKVSTVGLTEKITVSKSGLEVIPTEIRSEGETDLLVIPGGFGTREILKQPDNLAYIDRLFSKARFTATVCTGALILAKLGHLQNKTAITHHMGLDEMRALDGSIEIALDQRFVDEGTIITAAGISAGIDMSLYLVEKWFGKEWREKTQAYMEYKS